MESIADLIRQGDEMIAMAQDADSTDVALWLVVNWPQIRPCLVSHTITVPEGPLQTTDRCQYPACTENDDERCSRWLTGDCTGPKY